MIYTLSLDYLFGSFQKNEKRFGLHNISASFNIAKRFLFLKSEINLGGGIIFEPIIEHVIEQDKVILDILKEKDYYYYGLRFGAGPEIGYRLMISDNVYLNAACLLPIFFEKTDEEWGVIFYPKLKIGISFNL